MLRKAAFVLLASANVLMADEWKELSGDEIKEALTGVRLQYDGAWQDFRASGRTLYNAGRDSWGYWDVRGDEYCSQWPPADGWDCYKMAAKPGMLRFIGHFGDVTDGEIQQSD